MDQAATYKKYDAYKDSGVSWLGRIPIDWGVTKLRYEMNLINGYAFKPSDWEYDGIPIVRIQNLNGSEDYNYVSALKRIDARYHLTKGDIIFSWSGDVGTSFGAFRWEKDFPAYLNQHIFKAEVSYFYISKSEYTDLLEIRQ